MLKKDIWYRCLILAAIGLYLVLGTVYIFYGYIHPDEGHYLITGKLVYQGMVPYRDFQYVQSPLYPYFYGLFQLLIGGSLKASRSVSFFLGFLTLIMAARLAYKTHGPGAAAITLALIGFNPLIVYSLVIVKLFALTAFLITLSYSTWTSDKLSKGVRYCLSLLIMCLALGVRLSVLPAVVILFLVVLIKEWNNKQMIFVASIIILCSVSVIFLPFYFLSPEQFVFNIFTYHGLRDMGGLLHSLMNRFEAISGLVKDYFLPLLLFFMLVPTIFAMIKEDRNNNFNTAALAGIVICVSSIHFISHNSYISDYLSIIFPLFALLIGMAFAEMLSRINNEQIKKTFFICFFLCSLIMPVALTQSFAVPAIKSDPVKKLAEISKLIKMNTNANDLVWTYNNAIAAGAGRDVLPGTEMNSIAFSPEWSEKRCQKFKLLNKNLILGYIEKKIPKMIVVSDRSLSMNYPAFTWVKAEDKKSIFDALNRHYKLLKIYKNFGIIPTDETYLYLK